MRELPDANFTSFGPQERKINPLGRPNKRFLGRTLHTALRYNKREIERTQASCRQKLQELNNSHEQRIRRELLRERSSERHERRSRSKKRHKRRRRHSPSTSRSSRSRRSTSSSSRESRKQKKKHRKKRKKRKQRHRSRSSSSVNEVDQRKPAINHELPTADYYAPSHSIALAVAMACSQALAAQQTSIQSKETTPPAPEMSDIINELISDEGSPRVQQKGEPVTLSIESSSDEVQEVQTIDLSSYAEDSPGTTASESDDERSNSASCIALDDDSAASSSCSDIEIIETELQPDLKPEQSKEDKNRQPEESTTVDLTEDTNY